MNTQETLKLVGAAVVGAIAGPKIIKAVKGSGKKKTTTRRKKTSTRKSGKRR